MDRESPHSGALAGVRICDFSGQLAGAGATRTLAALGAEVIRVEDPSNDGAWDILRGAPPFVDERRGPEMGGAFNNHNVGKLGVAIDLRFEKGVELARRLVAVSDVVTENFAAGVLARRGLGYDDLVEVKPDIVYVSNCGFGHTGPYRGYRTWGPIVQACSGLTATSGLPGQPPAGWGYSYMDHMGAGMMAVAVLAALVHRGRTGEGQWVDMSCVEAGAALLGPDLLDVTVNGGRSPSPGCFDSNRSRRRAMAPHGIYPAAGDDNWVAVACRTDADWRELAALIDDGRHRSVALADIALEDRLARQDELDRRIAAWTVGQKQSDIVARLAGAGIPCSVVARPKDRIDEHPATLARGLFPTVDHPLIGSVRVDGLPMHLDATDWSITQPAPLLGQHDDEVLGGLLGLSHGELADLRHERVIR